MYYTVTHKELPSQFTIRVYGILLHPLYGVLVTDEKIKDKYYTKFPGGGLEFGEGTRECLKREFMEELGCTIQVGKHVYTTDFYVLSAFNTQQQILSIYYEVESANYPVVPTNKLPFTFSEGEIMQHKETGESETPR